jgi:hypothetical protein
MPSIGKVPYCFIFHEKCNLASINKRHPIQNMQTHWPTATLSGPKKEKNKNIQPMHAQEKKPEESRSVNRKNPSFFAPFSLEQKPSPDKFPYCWLNIIQGNRVFYFSFLSPPPVFFFLFIFFSFDKYPFYVLHILYVY